MVNKYFLFIALASSTAQAGPIQYEINRRDFVTLNRDVNEIYLKIRYPSSETTQVCGIQFRTNVPHFANTHLEAVISDVDVIEFGESPSGVSLTAIQTVAEPPYYLVVSDSSVPEIAVRIKTRTGETLRSLIQRVVQPDAAKKVDVPVEVIAIAKHCKDQSN